MDFNLNFHPLDNLIKDKTSFWLEALVPFVDYKYKKYLILYIKYKETIAILHALEDLAYVERCGFNCKAHSIDDIISGLTGFMPKDFSDNIKQMKNMMDMMKLMNTMDSGESGLSDFNSLFSSGSHSHSSDTSNQNPDDYNLLDSILTILDQEQ